MGLYMEGESQLVTPVFVPKSTGILATLSRTGIASLIPHCTPATLEFKLVPISTKFASEHRMVIAYNAGFGGLNYANGGTAFSSAPGELCSHAVRMARALGNSFGLEIKGSAIMFYLEHGRDFLADPDFTAIDATIMAWDQTDGDCSEESLQGLKKVFEKALRNKNERPGARRRKEYSGILLPALHQKARIVPVACTEFEDDGEPFWTADTGRYIGLGRRDRRETGYVPSKGNLDRPFEVYFRDFFAHDGSPINQTVLKMTQRRASLDWAGNILIMCHPLRDPEGFMDVTVEDLDNVAEYLVGYGRICECTSLTVPMDC
jgi:hypothetical protein